MIAGVIKSQPAGDARIVRSVEKLLRDLLGMVVVGGGGFIRTWVGFTREGSDMHMGGLHTHMGVSGFIGFMGFMLVLLYSAELLRRELSALSCTLPPALLANFGSLTQTMCTP